MSARVIRICPQCKLVFHAAASEVNRGGAKFCSTRCSSKFNQKDGGFNRKTGTMNHRGYILEWAPKHPAQVKGYVPQHRLIVEQSIGRLLMKQEVVHHKDHNRSNNKIENLEILSPSEHSKYHSTKFVIQFQGESMSFVEACRRKRIDRHCVVDRMRKYNCSRQEAFDMHERKCR